MKCPLLMLRVALPAATASAASGLAATTPAAATGGDGKDPSPLARQEESS